MAVVHALYVHIPFCHRICPFCAFAVHAERPALHAAYLAALAEEAALRAQEHAVPPGGVRSVYIGGGTPSTLSHGELESLLRGMRRHFPFAPDVELSLELNPEDATPAYLRGLGGLGVTRVSLGLQSLDETTLQALGRNNGAAAGREALEAVQAHGPANYNLDLMFGAPGTGPEAFLADVAAAAGEGTPHLSLYGLDVEPGTPFGRDEGVRAWAEAQRDEQARAYLEAAETLREAGYRHYEVSNLCQPGREGRQNLLVWDGANYLGLGVGAHSFCDGVRWHNERHIRPYQRRLRGGEAPVAYREILSETQRANEALMLALRRDTGLALSQWETLAGPWTPERDALARRLATEGRAEYTGEHLRLTPAGFMLADAVTEALMLA